MKLISFYTIIIVLCIVSCKQSTNKVEQSVNNPNVSDTLTVFSFDETPLFDTLTSDNIIESIKYIPLETNDKSVFDDSRVIVKMIANQLLVVSNNIDKPFAKLFDFSGKYIKDLIHIGRGPLELLDIYGYVANDSLKRVSFLGFDKIVTYDFVEDRLFANKMPQNDYMRFLPYMVSLNDGTFIGQQSGTGKENRLDDNKMPYMYVLDSDFRIISNKYYSIKRKLHQNLISDVTAFPCESWHINSTSGGGVFIDMYCDTVYSILDGGLLKPSYLIERGERYMPTIEEVNYPRDKKFKKIYYNAIVENGQYLFLKYYHKNSYYVNMWDKLNNKLLSHQIIESNYRSLINVSFDGYTGAPTIDYITADNRIYTIIPTEKLIGVIPDLKKDDNAVIVEIKLKDNFNSLKQ